MVVTYSWILIVLMTVLVLAGIVLAGLLRAFVLRSKSTRSASSSMDRPWAPARLLGGVTPAQAADLEPARPAVVKDPNVAVARDARFVYSTGDRPLEGYTIKRGVGRGGFGEVYYAVSDGGKDVALKLVQRHLDVELRGVTQCLNLKHPNLVTLYDVRQAQNGDCWVVMEHVTGESLSDLIARHPQGLGVAHVETLLRGICAGVSYLHDNGIVHRDLKPGNIFIEHGLVKIGDYGLAKFISASRRSGQTESVGTVHYMAPEVSHGRYGKEIDLYALGIILYEMLSGQVPFNGESPGEILMKHLTAQPDLSVLPEPLRSIVARLLAKDPADRFASVEAMLADLEMRPAEPAGNVAAIAPAPARHVLPTRTYAPPAQAWHSGNSGSRPLGSAVRWVVILGLVCAVPLALLAVMATGFVYLKATPQTSHAIVHGEVAHIATCQMPGCDEPVAIGMQLVIFPPNRPPQTIRLCPECLALRIAQLDNDGTPYQKQDTSTGLAETFGPKGEFTQELHMLMAARITPELKAQKLAELAARSNLSVGEQIYLVRVPLEIEPGLEKLWITLAENPTLRPEARRLLIDRVKEGRAEVVRRVLGAGLAPAGTQAPESGDVKADPSKSATPAPPNTAPGGKTTSQSIKLHGPRVGVIVIRKVA